MMALDELADDIFKEDNPKGDAVKTLISVQDKKKGKSSDIELKTDLTDDEVKIHTVLDVLNDFLEMSPDDFKGKCILSPLITRKERKLLSKDRKSRVEIVEIARTPETTNMMGGFPQQSNENFVKRMFTPRKKTQ